MNPDENETRYDNYRVRRSIEVERKCSNCKNYETNAWRRNLKGKIVCNPCGLYEKNLGIPRPPSLWKKVSQKRRKKTYSKALYARTVPVNVDFMVESTPLTVKKPKLPTTNESSIEIPEVPYWSPQEFLQRLIQSFDQNGNFIMGQQGGFELAPQLNSNFNHLVPLSATMMSSAPLQLRPDSLPKNGIASRAPRSSF